MQLDKRVFTKAALAIAIGLQGTLPGISQTQSAERHVVVNRMRPIGYWPVDEGAGDVLHDRSGNGNPGQIFNTAWENGLPDFIGGYQWAQIPPSPKYKVESFTLGGWLFSRRASYGRDGTLFVGIGNLRQLSGDLAAVFLPPRSQTP